MTIATIKKSLSRAINSGKTALKPKTKQLSPGMEEQSLTIGDVTYSRVMQGGVTIGSPTITLKDKILDDKATEADLKKVMEAFPQAFIETDPEAVRLKSLVPENLLKDCKASNRTLTITANGEIRCR